MKRSLPQSNLRHPLNFVMGNETHVRVLRELFRHRGLLGAPRLARDAGISRNAARVALIVLAEAGIVEALCGGRTVLYRADMDHPLATVLAELFRAEEERADAILAAVKIAVGEPTIIGAWIYGSFSRGEDRLGSDLDIAVLTELRDTAAVERLRERLDEAGDRLRFSPSVVGIDLADVARMSGGDPWWSNLVREATVIKGGRPETMVPTGQEQARG
jgi:predicted nucleotidyltransferase